ncbi:hypothetical protein DUI87_09107 [Hirundo rustica rustica]|uniref:Centromere protein U n=1 Tax=Hirundo rustica rustica TaxID=333673 RepID=A0A3M0KN25_HIRRU|nr:hypothetical protein DUI87_09107 [Hirundo rustica rustica]
MSSKKKIKRSHTSYKPEEQKASSNPRWKSLLLEEPDVSRILKVAETNQLEELDESFVDSPHSVQIWCPKKLKRSPRDITELDVVLAEVEKIAANYRQSIELNICRKAINDFSSAFKDQITDLIAGVQELKNMKKKNAKYGTSSLPALLVESRRILGAERHFESINMKLEEALAVQKEQRSRKIKCLFKTCRRSAGTVIRIVSA